MKRGIIFDFDGTLADTFPAVIEVFEDVTRQPRPLTKAEIQQFKHLSGPELLEVFRVPKWKVPYLFFRGRRMLRAHMNDVKPHAGMAEVIRELHGMGIPLYIVSSNSSENISTYLKKYGLSEYFDAIYGSASPFAKARKLLKLIGRENLDIENSWCVGDETRDVIAAHTIGVHIASVSWGYNSRESIEAKKPDVIVDTANELLQVLKDTWKK